MPQELLFRLFKSRVFQHLAFWLFAFLMLASFFAKEYGSTFLKINLIYTSLFLLSILLVVYLNILLLIPWLLQKGKWLMYLFSLLPALAFGVLINLMTFEYLSDWLFPDYYFISFYQIEDLLYFITTFLVVTTLLKLAKGWFELNEQKKKIDELEKEKVNAELEVLKSQINPHFLFNNLNNLYTLSLDQDSRVPEFLLKLSDGMRYMLYETNDHFVLLEKEIAYLNNYLDLQKLRTDQQAAINFEIIGDVKNQKVVPLIFIPFVENAFKHGIKGDIENVFIKMLLKIEAFQLVFSIQNNSGTIDKSGEVNYTGGVGLENVRKRLALSYGNQFDLIIKNDELTYSVVLKIPFQ